MTHSLCDFTTLLSRKMCFWLRICWVPFYILSAVENKNNSVVLIANKTATINENIILFDVSAYAYAIIRNKWKQIERKKKKCKDLYTVMPSRPFSYVHESNKLKKYFTYKDKQYHLRRSSVVCKQTCTCGSNYIGHTRRNLITRINEHKFDQGSEVCKHLLANPQHRFNFKQPKILGSMDGQKKLHLRVSSDTATPARSQHRWFIYPLTAFQHIMAFVT